MRVREQRSADSGQPPISWATAQAICQDVIAFDRDFIAVLSKYGAPQGWKHGGQVQSAGWPVAPNSAGVRSMSVFHNRVGRVRNVIFHVQGATFGGGAAYWMEADEFCVPNVLFADRPRGNRVSVARLYDEWPNMP